MATRFRQLPDLVIAPDEWNRPLELGPDNLRHGRLCNGMQYFVRATSKPKHRAALALAVRIGSVVEEENEQGVAHIVEHLAFNATDRYQSHDIVKFLESIGAEFGACQNAYTTPDETVFELTVPTDNAMLLEQAFSVFAEFATAIRCAPEDLAKERGAVLEEWRMGKNSSGRAQEAHWKLILQGCKYAERLTIGLEKVIQTVPAGTVRTFYERWYRPENMAVVAAGDFDADAVVAMITEKLQGCRGRDPSPALPIPRFGLAPHKQPRFGVFVDKETQQNLVYVSFKHDADKVTTTAEYLADLRGGLFVIAVNARLYRIGRRPDPPFYNAMMVPETLTATIESDVLTASTQKGNTLRALETILTELARIRQHGFSQREVRAAINISMADTESLYMERDQDYAQEVCAEYVRHFMSGELVIGRAREAQLAKTLLPKVTAADLQKLAYKLHSSCNCVIKVASHRREVSEEELAEVVRRVDRAEANGEIGPWEQIDAETSVIPKGKEPLPGRIVSRQEWPEVDATELTLSNGMKVCYKCTDYLEDQILMTGIAPGGLSDVPEEEFRTLSFSCHLAQEQGLFGLKPEVLMDVLMGKRCGVGVQEGAYWRSFGGEQSPVDLDTAMQLIYALFASAVTPVPSELHTCMQYLRDIRLGQMRNPTQVFGDRVLQLCYNSYYFRPPSLRDIRLIDPYKACAHFTESFRNPAEFILCVTGSIKAGEFEALAERYLASIPPLEGGRTEPKSVFDLNPLPFSFPQGVIEEEVRAPMINPQSQARIAFPVVLDLSDVDGLPSPTETHWLSLVCQLLETKLLQKLRFEFGEVYTVSVGPNFSSSSPNELKRLQGDVSISFSCDPDSARRLIDMALAETQRLQEVGPTAEEVDTLLTLEQREWETVIQENAYWHETLVSGYKSRTYSLCRNVDKVYKLRISARDAVRAEASPETLQAALTRLLPNPCRSRYVAVTLLPQKPLSVRVMEATAALIPSPSRSKAYWITTSAVLAAAVAAIVLIKCR